MPEKTAETGKKETKPAGEVPVAGNTPAAARPKRIATVSRKTKETDITVTFSLDGSGEGTIDTGIGFFDHMLSAFARHGFFYLDCRAVGDLNVDCHHTIEDVGIVMGQAIREAIGDKAGIRRFGNMILPMDDALVLCAIDLSGRPYLACDYRPNTDRVGYFDTQMVQEFFYAISYSAGMNLHIQVLSGTNDHHIIEAAFKAFAKALDQASEIDDRLAGQMLTTKGSI